MSRLTCCVWLVACFAGGGHCQEAKDAVFERYRAAVEQARGLVFKRPVRTHTLTPAEYLKYVRSENSDSGDESGEGDQPQDLGDHQAAWRALGLIPEAFDLYEAEESDEEGSTDGFYVSDDDSAPFAKGSLVVVRKRGDDTTEVTAHELLHALHDQHFNLNALEDAVALTPTGAPVFDHSLTEKALEEGVATHFGVEIARKLGSPNVGERESAYGIPDWVGAKAEFPYAAGSAFAKALHAAGGLKAVDKAYAKPPTSTEQILHPERYLRATPDLPSTVKTAGMASALPGEWATLDSNSLGEFGVGWLLGPSVGAGWDGDHYEVIQDAKTGQTIATWYTTWDSAQDAAEFHTATSRGEGFGSMKPGDLMVVEQRGKDVFMASGVKPDQVEALLARARATTVHKQPGDDDSWANRPRARSPLERLREHALSATTLARRGATPEDVSRLEVQQLSAEGRRLARRVMASLARHATKGRVKDLGKGRFVLPTGETVHYANGVLTTTSGARPAVDALAAILATPPARGSSKGLTNLLSGRAR